jgi:hypothetical protein
VRPVVSHAPDLVHQGALRWPKGVAEHIVPLTEHRAEQGRGVPDDIAARVATHLVAAAALYLRPLVAPQAGFQLSLDERGEACPQRLKTLPYPVPVAQSHCGRSLLVPQVSAARPPGRRCEAPGSSLRRFAGLM